MLALDLSDLVRGDATNASEVDFTLHGVASGVITQLASGQLAASEGTLYTSPAAGTVVTSITLVNTGAGANAVNLYLQPAAGTSRRLIPKNLSLAAGYSLYFDGRVVNVIDTSGKILASVQPDSITSFLEDNPSNGEVAKAPTSNWAYDHAAASDPHAGYVLESLYDADSVVTATSDNTPIVTTMAEQTVLGRLTGAHPDDVVIGIADNNIVQIDQADAADNDIAKFTAAGLEGRSYAELKADLDLEIGTDVLAQQTIGIADNNLLEVDDAAAADNDFARFTAAGIEGLTVAEAIAALLAAALPENTAIILDAALSADGKYSGIVEAGVAGVTLAFGDLVYYAVATSKWELADADAAATAFGKLGICVAAADINAATVILLWGKVNAATAFPDLTIGAPVFVSTTAGDVQVAAPSGTGDIVRIVGYGNTINELFFCPDNTYLELV